MNFISFNWQVRYTLEVHLDDPEYQKTLAKRMQDRLDWLNKYDEEHPTQPIQEEAKKTLEGIIKELN